MKKTLFLTALLTFLGSFYGYSQKKKLDNIFYCFNNSVRLSNAPDDQIDQAASVKKAGFDGFSGHISEDYYKRREALDKAGLLMPEIYWGAALTAEGEFVFDKKLADIIRHSENRNLLVALFLNAKDFMHNQKKGDSLFAAGIRDLAAYASSFNVKVAIYPHAGNYCEKSTHAIKLATMINRENAGVVFNTCHFLKSEGEEGIEEKALAAIPYLFMVSINGADSGDTMEMDWDRLIQPLGEGTFDTYKLVKLFRDYGYEGPFGLQCYNIRCDFYTLLENSVKAWKGYRKRYSREK